MRLLKVVTRPPVWEALVCHIKASLGENLNSLAKRIFCKFYFSFTFLRFNITKNAKYIAQQRSTATLCKPAFNVNSTHTLAVTWLPLELLRCVSSKAKVGRMAAMTPEDRGRMIGPPSTINLWSHAKAVSLIKGSVIEKLEKDSATLNFDNKMF